MSSPATSSDQRRQQILHAKPLPIMLRMATPNVLAFLVQASVNMTEVWYVGQLGTTSLAAMAFVFPGLMLMQMLSGGALGGAVSSSIARSLGAGLVVRAQQLMWHAIAIAAFAGIVFFSSFQLFGAKLLALVGAEGEVLDLALSYASIIFSGCFSIWMASLLSGVLRGMGEMRIPALLMGLGGIVQVLLSGTLVLGWFGVAPLGIKGAAISVITVATVNSVISLLILFNAKLPLNLLRERFQLQRGLFADILRVGALACVSPFLSVSSIMIVNGIISGFGAAAVAGYGIGSRLEFLLIPMVFGFGTAMNTMVGMNVGAGNVQRAEHIAFIGGRAAAMATGIIGVTLAVFPSIWIGMFTSDPATLEAGATYLRYSGWAFAFQGLGLSLYFASQGAGTVTWPVIANFARFGIGAGGAWLAVSVLDLGITWVFISLAIGMVCYGAITACSIWLGAWRKVKPIQF